VQTITPFLWFDDQAEQAAEFYVSVFPNSEILRVNRSGGGGIGDPGTVMSVSLVIDGLRIEAFNGGPDHPFTEAISLFVPADTQDESTASGTACWRAAAGRSSAAGSRTGGACPGRSSRRCCSSSCPTRTPAARAAPCRRCSAWSSSTSLR